MSAPPALAFANDCDFATWHTYCEVRQTITDLGLPFEDSCWLFDPQGSDMALFGSSTRHKGPRHDALLEEMAAGRLTILHSAGNFSKGGFPHAFRDELEYALDYVRQHAAVPRIWVNHGNERDRQNIGYGADTYHEGDNPASDAYCLDLLHRYGLRYFWTDTDYDNAHFVLRPLLVQGRGRDGTPFTRFRRFRGPLPKAPDACTLAWQLREEHLQELVSSEGVTVIYQHWHVHRDADMRPHTARGPVFPPESRARLERLAQLHQDGVLTVGRLERVLDGAATAETQA